MIGIAVGAFGLLVALGVMIGHLLDKQAQDRAWKRIAVARRDNAALARELRSGDRPAPVIPIDRRPAPDSAA